MSLDELYACKEELEECETELEEESSRLARCLGEKDDLEMLIERIRELPEELAEWLSERYDVAVFPGDVAEIVEVILDAFGIDWEGRRIEKWFRRYFEEREAERLRGWVETHAEHASRMEIEMELEACRELLEACRERVEGTREEAYECEAKVEEDNAIAREISESLPELLTTELIDYLREEHGVDAEHDGGEILRLIERLIDIHE
jgi:hypothetical protein